MTRFWGSAGASVRLEGVLVAELASTSSAETKAVLAKLVQSTPAPALVPFPLWLSTSQSGQREGKRKLLLLTSSNPGHLSPLSLDLASSCNIVEAAS